MTNLSALSLRAVAVALVLAALPAPAAAKPPRPVAQVAAQLDFGVEMARRGLWGEALFRFAQADRLAPDNPRVLNNLAVAYEARGRFEDALATYQKALKIEPANRDLKRNYSRFVEFYQSFKGPKAPAVEAGPPGPPGGETPGGRPELGEER